MSGFFERLFRWVDPEVVYLAFVSAVIWVMIAWVLLYSQTITLLVYRSSLALVVALLLGFPILSMRAVLVESSDGGGDLAGQRRVMLAKPVGEGEDRGKVR